MCHTVVSGNGVATRLEGRQQAASAEVDTTVHGVFVACLIGGFAATLLFAVLGAIGGASGHGAGHLHAGHGPAGHLPPGGASHANLAHPAHGGHGHAASHESHGSAGHNAGLDSRLASAAGWALSWLSPLALAAAVLLFGGVGLLAESLLPVRPIAVVVILAVLGALLGAALVRALMAAFLRSSAVPLSAGADGAIGTLSAPIRSDAAGEVIYTLEGLRRSAAARSVDGAPLPRGAHVVIVRRERGVAWVSPLDPLTVLGAPADGTSIDGSRDSGRQRRGDRHPPP